MFAKHLYYSAVGGQLAAIRVFRKVCSDPELFADLVDVLQLVRCVFIGTEDAEAIHVGFHDIPEESSEGARVFGFDNPRFIDL